MQVKQHPHIVKAVINDAQRRQVLENLKWRLSKVAERRRDVDVFQDRIDHIILRQKLGKLKYKILIEYTILIVSMTFNWEKIYGLCANTYTTLDFSNITNELDRIKKILVQKAENPQSTKVQGISLSSILCRDWVIT
jgi:hemoglobin-like flavoprotein